MVRAMETIVPGLSARHFRFTIVQPVLARLGLPGEATAMRLLLGTAAVESGLRHLAQLGSGPALGLYQIEPATHEDLWVNFLGHRQDLSERVRAFAHAGTPRAMQLAGNLDYATAIARLVYFRRPEPLPAPEPEALGAYWKAHYNTAAGAGTVADFMRAWRLVEPAL